MTTYTHQELLKKYAEAIVKVGLNLRKGQRLLITKATARGVPPAGRALVHEVTKAAYAAGAKYVEAIWGDEEYAPHPFAECARRLIRRISKIPDQCRSGYDQKR